ncbi:MAG TPA: choline/ethanolamine kinase family protein [Steroidobacteraceae bacterium]|nr:choline/ethanolamine kinase family protein [Steroidobacteraceae bacterium]
MKAGLPPPARAAIEATSGALGLGDPVVSLLPGGVANRSFRLQGNGQDVVLKLAGAESSGLGADLRSEVAMQALAADAGLAPRVVHADPAMGFIASRHAEGRFPSDREIRQAPFLERVGRWLAALHALPLPAGLPIVDFGERAAAYLGRLSGAFEAKLARELASRRAALGATPRQVPCHHDLHRRNLLDDGRRLLVVDWEYAGPGDPAADLAACIGYHGLDAAATDALFTGYGGALDRSLRARVEALGWIFDCLWYGWNAAAAQAGFAADPEERSRLAARLAH